MKYHELLRELKKLSKDQLDKEVRVLNNDNGEFVEIENTFIYEKKDQAYCATGSIPDIGDLYIKIYE